MAIGDLFRPKYKHSNPEIRAAAIAALDAESVDQLVEVARSDSDFSLRKKAIEKLADADVLFEVAESQKDPGVRKYALGRAVEYWMNTAISSEEETEAKGAFNRAAQYGGDRNLAEIAVLAQSSEIREQALARLDDDKALAHVVRKTARATQWRDALARIRDEKVLRGIAIGDKRKEVGLAALERIESDGVLEEISVKAKNKAVRAKAKRQRIAPTPKVESAPSVAIPQAQDSDKRARAERTQIVRELELLATGSEWVESRSAVDGFVERWHALGRDDDDKLRRRFIDHLTSYNKRHAAYVASVAAKEETEAKKGAVSSPQEVQETEAEPARTQAPEPQVEDSSVAPEALHREPEPERDALSEEELRADNQDDLTRLCEVLEDLAERKVIKGMERTIKDADRARSKIGRLPDAVQEKLSERYQAARRQAVIRLGELREAEDWKRWANIPKMESLLADAKSLLAEEGAKGIQERLKRLQADWRDLGAASPRERADELWAEFKETCDQIYEGVKAEREKRNAEQKENLARKEELCKEAEALAESTDWEETGLRLKELQAEWKRIGPVPRRKSDRIWKRFRSACDAFFEKRAPYLEEKQAEQQEHVEAKKAVLAELEELANKKAASSEEVSEQLDLLATLQEKWRETGRVRRKEFQELHARYTELCEAIAAKKEQLKEAARAALAAAVAHMEELVAEITDAGWDTDANDLAAKVLHLHDAFHKLAPDAPGWNELEVKVRDLVRRQLEADVSAYKDTVLDPDKSAVACIDLIEKAEQLCPRGNKEDAKDPEAMAAKLRDAFAENALGGVLSANEPPIAERIAELQAAWARIGPVPGPRGTALWEEFDSACKRALEGQG